MRLGPVTRSCPVPGYHRSFGSRLFGRCFFRPALLAVVTCLLLAGVASRAADRPPSGRILRGVAVDPSGRALGGVEIVVTREPAGSVKDAAPKTVRSDARGRFALAGLAPGSYRIVAVKGGYSVLVGKVDTLVRNFLEIILQPSGPPAPPGSRPQGSAWALRLPERDHLEARGAEPGSAVASAESAEGRAPVLFEMQRAWLSDASGTTDGLTAAFSGQVPIEGFGRFAASVRHRAVGQGSGARDSGNVVLASWRPEAGVGTGIPTIEVSAVGRNRRGVPAGAVDSSGFSQRQLGMRAEWSVLRPGTLVEASIEAGLARGAEDFAPLVEGSQGFESSFSARRIAAHLSARSRWTRHHELEGSIDLMRASGGLLDDPLDRSAALVTFSDRTGLGGLESLDGDTVDLRLADTWRPTTRWTAATRWRVMQTDSHVSAMRIATSFGATFRPSESWALQGEIGMARGDDQPVAPSWRIALSRRQGPWSLSVESSEVRGLAAWEPQSADLSASPSLLTERSARVRRTRARADWLGAGGWPAVAIQAERIDASGRLAAGWSSAFPLSTVVDQGRACGENVQILVDSPATGTFVSIGWSRVEDDSAGGLLEGAAAWQQRALRVRQRLLIGDGDWAWHLMLNVEAGAFVDPPSPSQLPEGRLALADQRRISGGVAVAF